MMWPAGGVTASHFADVLTRTYNWAQNEHWKIVNGDEPVDIYLKWADAVRKQLRTVVRAEDMDRLVLTRRYWATLANPEPSMPLKMAVREEAEERVEDLKNAKDAALKLAERWSGKQEQDTTHIVVPDTNVFVSWCDEVEKKTRDIAEIDFRTPVEARTFDAVRVVIPLLVIDELEITKDKRQDVRGRQARRAVNTLWDWFSNDPDWPYVLHPRDANSGGVTVELLADPAHHVELPRRDEELIARAVAVQDLRGTKVRYLTHDTGAAFRAKRAGLVAHRLRSIRDAKEGNEAVS